MGVGCRGSTGEHKHRKTFVSQCPQSSRANTSCRQLRIHACLGDSALVQRVTRISASSKQELPNLTELSMKQTVDGEMGYLSVFCGQTLWSPR